jgi:hypothetical protein
LAQVEIDFNAEEENFDDVCEWKVWKFSSYALCMAGHACVYS